jgi:hypothetical protein
MVPKKVIIHCSDSKNGASLDISAIRKFHVEQRGWSDVGYHMVIQPNGEVQNGRGLNVVGAHCEGENHDSIGICLIGKDKFTIEQFRSLHARLVAIKQCYGISEYDVSCHHEWASAKKQGKTCPNINIRRLLYWLITNDEKVLDSYIYV